MPKVTDVLTIDSSASGVSENSSFNFSAADIASLLGATSEGIALAQPVRDGTGSITDFRWVFTNTITEKLFGISFIGKSLLEVFPEDQHTGPFNLYVNVIENGLPLHWTLPYSLNDHITWIRITALNIRQILMLSFRDISTEVSLTESEERYRIMVESIPHLIWTADAEGFPNFTGKQWVDFTGQQIRNGLNKGWLDFIHPDDIDNTIKAWTLAVNSKSGFKTEHRILNSKGHYRWFKTNSRPVLNFYGNVIKWLGSSTDIHEEMVHLEEITRISRELEEKNDILERINNDLDIFVYTASHDLTAPITNIEGLTSLIRYELHDCLQPQQLEYLDLMTSSINKLHDNIRDLTEIISIKQDTGREREAVSFADILKDIEEDLQPVISVLKATIHTHFRVPSMLFARKNIRTILFNLISNALKYRSPERQVIIHISTAYTATGLLLEVNDNGRGMTEEQIPQLFGIFKRFHADIHGNGVGLYMIKRIIENNKGKIEVISKLNTGTVFQVHLPLP